MDAVFLRIAHSSLIHPGGSTVAFSIFSFSDSGDKEMKIVFGNQVLTGDQIKEFTKARDPKWLLEFFRHILDKENSFAVGIKVQGGDRCGRFILTSGSLSRLALIADGKYRYIGPIIEWEVLLGCSDAEEARRKFFGALGDR